MADLFQCLQRHVRPHFLPLAFPTLLGMVSRLPGPPCGHFPRQRVHPLQWWVSSGQGAGPVGCPPRSQWGCSPRALALGSGPETGCPLQGALPLPVECMGRTWGYCACPVGGGPLLSGSLQRAGPLLGAGSEARVLQACRAAPLPHVPSKWPLGKAAHQAGTQHAGPSLPQPALVLISSQKGGRKRQEQTPP